MLTHPYFPDSENNNYQNKNNELDGTTIVDFKNIFNRFICKNIFKSFIISPIKPIQIKIEDVDVESNRWTKCKNILESQQKHF